MPKSPKTKTARLRADTLKLHIIDPREFTSRAAVRKFVLGDRFAALSHAVVRAAAPWEEDDSGFCRDIEDEGRNVASAIGDDLASLARVASLASDAPVAATCSGVFDLGSLLVGLLELGRALAATSSCDEAGDAVLLMAINAAHNIGRDAREAA